MIIVPDASVILKWVLEKEDEPDHRQAFRLQEGLVAEQIEIRLPALWRYEVGNVFRHQRFLKPERLAMIGFVLFFQDPFQNDGCVGHDNHSPTLFRSRLTVATISSPLIVALRFLKPRSVCVTWSRFRRSNSFLSASLTTWLRRRGGTSRNRSSLTCSSIDTLSLAMTSP